MLKHEDKICPRCYTTFECKVGDIINCQCYATKLNDAERNYLFDCYLNCICANCIIALKAILEKK